MPGTPYTKGIKAGWVDFENGWGNDVNENLRHLANYSLEQWAWNHTASSGLTYAYFGGVAVGLGGAPIRIADSSIVLTANSTNYVERTTDGVVSSNTIQFTQGRYAMAKVVTGVNSITTVEDWRSVSNDGVLTTEVVRRTGDKRAVQPCLAASLKLKYQTGATQTVKITELIARITGFQRVGDRLFGAESDLDSLKGVTRHFIRFNNLDDLSDYTVAPITPIAQDPNSDNCWAMAYSPSNNRFYTMTNGGPGGVNTRLLELNPDTMEIIEKTQSFTPLTSGSTAGVVAGAIVCNATHAIFIGYNTGDFGVRTHCVAYRLSDWTATEFFINGGVHAAAAQIGPEGDLYVQGEWSHGVGVTGAHSWVARLSTVDFSTKQFAPILNEFDSTPYMVVHGDYIYLAILHDGPFCIYRIQTDDLTQQIPIHVGGPPRTFVQGVFFDGKYIWGTIEGVNFQTFLDPVVIPLRLIRIDPDTLEVTLYNVPEIPTSFGDSVPSAPTFKPYFETFGIVADGQRIFINRGNFSADTGVAVAGQPAGPYMSRFVLPTPMSRHYASLTAGNPALTFGPKGFGHGRTLLTTEVAGLHSVGGGVRIQAVPTPGVPRTGPVQAEPEGDRSVPWNYYVVAVDAFGNETLPGPVGTVMGSAVLGNFAFQRVAWDHVDGAVQYIVLRGNTSTKIATVSTNGFVDDGSYTPSAYTPQTRNRTADVYIDGWLGIGTVTPIASLHVAGDLYVEGKSGFNGTTPIAKPTVSGSRGGSAALQSLLTALSNYGLVIDTTS